MQACISRARLHFFSSLKELSGYKSFLIKWVTVTLNRVIIDHKLSSILWHLVDTGQVVETDEAFQVTDNVPSRGSKGFGQHDRSRDDVELLKSTVACQGPTARAVKSSLR